MARGDAPQDSYHLVGISFFILGLGTLLPWNFFITAIPVRLAAGVPAPWPQPPSPWTRGVPGAFHTMPPLTPHYARLHVCPLKHRASERASAPFTDRKGQAFRDAQILQGQGYHLFFSRVCQHLLREASKACLVERRPHSYPSTAFCAVLQGSLFGQLGTMPSTYSTLFLSGQGLAGIFAALAMLMAMASGVDAQTSALGYFVTPCVGIFTSIVCYLSLPHLEFARYYLAKKPLQAQGQELETKAELLQSDEKNSIPNSPQKVALTLDLDAEKEPELEPEEIQKPGKPSVFIVFRKIWLTALCLVLVFAVTLSVFPAITAMVTSSTSPGKWSQFFNPICCFLLFNIMDWVGRSLTSYFLWPDEDSRLLPLLVCLRVLFVPLFMLCHVPERSRLPVLFPQDAYFITFMLLFAVSNGYLMSLTMCLAPRQVLPHEREVAGTLMTFFLALGLSCGAALSFLFKALL
uniref:equilibrative nucleoside transporter 2 n=1 Tax=Panthera onca TaxID=9690 RepID=UPI002952E6A0|nr:equilibrative nucleoside transporter 2 [Panthera onca]